MATGNSNNINNQGTVYYNGIGTFSELDGITPGFVLKSNGTGVSPSFTSNNFINLDADSGSASGSTITIDGGSTGLLTSGSSSTLSLSGDLHVNNGGTGVTSVTTTPTATEFIGWDTNNNISANNLLQGYQTRGVSSTPVSLTVASPEQQFFTQTGTGAGQTVNLPNPSTLQIGQSFTLNDISGFTAQTLTINSSGGNSVNLLQRLSTAKVTCIASSGTTAAAWRVVQRQFFPFGQGGLGAFSSGVPFNIVSIPVSSGYYIFSGCVTLRTTGSVSSMTAAINTTSASVSTNFVTSNAVAVSNTLVFPSYAVYVSSPTTFYINFSLTYSGAVTLSGCGFYMRSL